jgi:putative hydrolase of the HAD superfamily
MRDFDAVVFDFGGVIVSPITEKLNLLAERHGVETSDLLEVLLGPRYESTADHPWHRAERGELAIAELQTLLRPIATTAGIELAGDEMDVLFEANYRYHRGMLDRIARLREEGYRTALLTNSVKEFRPTLEAEMDLTLFDVVVDSSEVGSRKPEPAIYERVNERIGVEAHRVLYLDDFHHNLDAARAAGWTVIHVTDPDDAIVELDRLLGPVSEATS